jgi:hypothetical protein
LTILRLDGGQYAATAASVALPGVTVVMVEEWLALPGPDDGAWLLAIRQQIGEALARPLDDTDRGEAQP